MINNPQSAKSLVDVIRYWTATKPASEVLRFYPQGEGDFTCHSFSSFDMRCRAIAKHLQPYQGSRAILLYQSGIEFLEAFFACFYAGVTAVPAYPPRRNHNLDRLLSLLDDCTPSLILSAQQVIQIARPLCDEAFPEKVRDIPWIETDTLQDKDADDYTPYTPSEDQLAFLQYTSGSTGTPKGVMVTHKNLMTNIRMSAQVFDIPVESRCISWLPLFHDMGLIGSVMTPMYWGSGAVLMPPAAFLQKPLRWLKLLDEFGKQGPVGCPAPNFSYQLCVDQISDEDAATLDLSPYVLALSGAEPIRAATIEAFCNKFSPYGFDRKALRPCFGMAESTLISTCRPADGDIVTRTVSAAELTRNRFVDSEDGIAMVSSGQSCQGQTLRIVDPETLTVLNDDQVGEIWLAGDHIAQGYWQQDAATQANFQAKTACGQGPFMRTGDLGVISRDELFVTGRLKDLLIIRGRNHYPQDIEYTASSSLDSLHLDNAAAISVDIDNDEKLVIIQEVNRSHRKNFDSVAAATHIRNTIAREHGVETHSIVFIRFASIPKTSSGKIQRHKCKQMYLDGGFKRVGQWQTDNTNQHQLPDMPQKPAHEISRSELEQWIREWLAAKVNTTVDDIPLEASIDGLGLDSVDIVQLTGKLESWLGKPIDNMLIWEQPHIRALTAAILQLADTPQTPQSHDTPDDDIEGFI